MVITASILRRVSQKLPNRGFRPVSRSKRRLVSVFSCVAASLNPPWGFEGNPAANVLLRLV